MSNIIKFKCINSFSTWKEAYEGELRRMWYICTDTMNERHDNIKQMDERSVSYIAFCHMMYHCSSKYIEPDVLDKIYDQLKGIEYN